MISVPPSASPQQPRSQLQVFTFRELPGSFGLEIGVESGDLDVRLEPPERRRVLGSGPRIDAVGLCLRYGRRHVGQLLLRGVDASRRAIDRQPFGYSLYAAVFNLWA